MNLRTKIGIILILVGIVIMHDLSKKSEEMELKLYKLGLCGIDIDRLDTKTKNKLGTMSDGELYYICEFVLKSQEI